MAPLGNLAMIDSITESAARRARGMTNSNRRVIKQSILDAKLDYVDHHESNSLQTILAITNTMVSLECKNRMYHLQIIARLDQYA
jgi:hypothetical protein